MTVSFTVWDSKTIILYYQTYLQDGIAEATEELHPGDDFYGVTFEQFKTDTSGLKEIPERRSISR